MLPREQVELVRLAHAHQYDEAAALADRVQQLADVIFSPPVLGYRARLKEVLAMLEVIPNATLREPLLAMTMDERGVELAVVSRALGHANLSTTADG